MTDTEQEPAEAFDFQFGELVLDMVRTSEEGNDEKYIIHPKGPDVIRAGTEVVLKSGWPVERMAEQFRAVLALAYVLEEKVQCPAAAKTVAETLLSHAEVPKILSAGRRNSPSEIDRKTKGFRRFLDNNDLARAPQIDAKAPSDALKLSALITPGSQDMRGRAAEKAQAQKSVRAETSDQSLSRPAPARRGRTTAPGAQSNPAQSSKSSKVGRRSSPPGSNED